jgi:two-component system, LytTR family, sensor kinase
LREAGKERGRRFLWGIILCCWTVLALFFTGRNIVLFISRGQPIVWSRGVFFEIIYWYLWALFTPLVFWIARAFPLERGRRGRNIPLLVLAGLVIAPLQVSLEIMIDLLLAWGLLHAPSSEIAQRLGMFRRIVLIESFSGFLIYAVMIGCYYAFDYYRKWREGDVRASRLEGQLARAELQNLKMQLHPHFLFNTLNTISVLMARDTAAANGVLIRLSDLLRMTLDQAGAQEVTLKQELEFLQKYLEIEQTRFQERLKVEVSVDPSVLDARVPNLILQPLVENAIRHGVAQLVSEGRVEISARREDGMVELSVRDNGPGIGGSECQSLRERVGLSNTRARLEQLYGARHSFRLRNRDEGGLEVKVAFPFSTDETTERQRTP